MSKKRDLHDELLEGFDALADQRAGKRTLRTHALKVKPAPKISARELAKVRQDMKLSRGLFARYLRTNVRTLENWEQGRAKPNAQAALLIRMVQRLPRSEVSTSVGSLLRRISAPGPQAKVQYIQVASWRLPFPRRSPLP
jgi:putative transcriptional regulator